MNHNDHVALLRNAAPTFEGTWADLGAGSGAFTLALADLLGGNGQIIAVDKDRSALAQNQREMTARFPKAHVEYRTADFTRDLDLPFLDGIAMANSLHFHRQKGPILDRVRAMLKPGGRFILVEYNVDHGNMWVPHPLSFETWKALSEQHGLMETRLLHVYPSRFLHEIYSAGSVTNSNRAADHFGK